MKEKLNELIISLNDSIRELSFDVNFCLEILKQDKDIAEFYDRCKKRFDEQITIYKKGDE